MQLIPTDARIDDIATALRNRRTRIDAVCHHCGKPLCREDRVLIADVAFAAFAGEAGTEAVHCRPCKRQHHNLADIPL